MDIMKCIKITSLGFPKLGFMKELQEVCEELMQELIRYAGID